MKLFYLKSLFLTLFSLMGLSAFSHDFEVDGIYYVITSSTDHTVSVSFRGEEYDTFSDEYTGNVAIPASVQYDGITYSVTSIGNICSGLTSVTIPNSVTSIGEFVFEDCSGMTSFSISSSVKSIGDYTFWGCSSLTSVTIPEGVTSIGDFAFHGCSSMTSLTIPNSVTSIGDRAFEGCSGLTDVYCYAEEVPSTGRYVFRNVSVESATLHVPAASIEAYQSAEPWSDFGNIVPLTDEEVAVKDVVCQEEGTTAIFTLDGKRVDALQRGVNIVKMADGSTRKVLVK